MASLRFSFGTMGSGKSTVALQIHHNLSSRELYGLLLTTLDREGRQVTSRLGVAAPAIEVTSDLPVSAMEVFHAEDMIQEAWGLAAVSSQPQGTPLYMPHYNVNNKWWTWFALANLDESVTSTPTITILEKDGNRLEEAEPEISAKGRALGDVRDFFGMQ